MRPCTRRRRSADNAARVLFLHEACLKDLPRAAAANAAALGVATTSPVSLQTFGAIGTRAKAQETDWQLNGALALSAEVALEVAGLPFNDLVRHLRADGGPRTMPASAGLVPPVLLYLLVLACQAALAMADIIPCNAVTPFLATSSDAVSCNAVRLDAESRSRGRVTASPPDTITCGAWSQDAERGLSGLLGPSLNNGVADVRQLSCGKIV